MKKCLTKSISVLKGVSGCLVEKPECEYFQRFGFSIVCQHPDHVNFQAHRTGVMTNNEINDRYNTLREKRRSEFMANLDQESKTFFCE